MILLLDSWAALPSWWRKLRILTPSRARQSLSFRARHIWSRVRPEPAEDADANHPFGEVPWSVVEKVYVNAARDFQPNH